MILTQFSKFYFSDYSKDLAGSSITLAKNEENKQTDKQTIIQTDQFKERQLDRQTNRKKETKNCELMLQWAFCIGQLFWLPFDIHTFYTNIIMTRKLTR